MGIENIGIYVTHSNMDWLAIILTCGSQAPFLDIKSINALLLSIHFSHCLCGSENCDWLVDVWARGSPWFRAIDAAGRFWVGSSCSPSSENSSLNLSRCTTRCHRAQAGSSPSENSVHPVHDSKSISLMPKINLFSCFIFCQSRRNKGLSKIFLVCNSRELQIRDLWKMLVSKMFKCI